MRGIWGEKRLTELGGERFHSGRQSLQVLAEVREGQCARDEQLVEGVQLRAALVRQLFVDVGRLLQLATAE